MEGKEKDEWLLRSMMRRVKKRELEKVEIIE